MKQAPEHLRNLIEPIIEGLGYECVGIEYNIHPQNGLLRIYIDHKNGILVDDCTKVSHQISGVLDVEDPITGNYQLEVSSPGDERPFFKIEQFERFIGHTIAVNLFKPLNNRRKFNGIIEKIEDTTVFFMENEQLIAVDFSSISKARLVPQYLFKQGGRNGK